MIMDLLPHMVMMIGRLPKVSERQTVAQELARMVGAEDLVIFVADPSIETLIPAPGFPPTLPDALQWHTLVEQATAGREARGIVASATGARATSALALAISPQGVMVLLGGEPRAQPCELLRTSLVTSVALFVAEQRVSNENAIMQLARNSAAQLREQAAAVEEARRAAHHSLVELKKVEAAREQQARELERSNRDLQQFAAIVSHDLQEPLRMVSSHLSLIEARYLELMPDAARTYMSRAQSGALRMARLIRSLLIYAQVGATKREPVSVSMEAVVHEALANLQTRVAETSARVEVSPLPMVRGDSILLIQLVQNLVSNALKFIRADTVHIRIVAEKASDGAWKIIVADNGIGIEEKHRQKIFEAFQRLHSNAEYEGTGIGLATCRRIVEMHDGTIEVTSTVGVGSSFSFILPAARTD